MRAALDEDRLAQGSSCAFMLARFVCPTSRIRELPSLGRGIAAVLDDSFPAHSPVAALEAPPASDLSSLLGLAPEVYVEVPLDDSYEGRLDELGSAGLRAKVRCGGAVVPSIAQVAAFLRACRERGIVFKATAGLHNAVRTDGEHGLLNLLAAVVFGDEERALGEDEAGAFVLRSDAFSWRERSAGSDELGRARRERLHSIGSCSFFEPVGALEALGVLPL
jgi:hypothetical protein